MPALLLLKPSKSSKWKEHHAPFKRRLKLWEEGKIKELLYEGQIIQEKLKSSDSSKTIAKISMKFRILMSKGNANCAWKLLTINMQMEFYHLQTRHYSYWNESILNLDSLHLMYWLKGQ